MAVLGQDILNDIKNAEETNYELLPEGEYTVKVDGTELKATKNGTGQFIRTTFVVLAPKYQGRKLFHNFNIINENSEAMRIGKQQVKALMQAGGLTQEQINQFNDTDQLIGLTCNVTVGIEKGQGAYGPQNRIKRFLRVKDTATLSLPFGTPAAPAPASSGAPSFAAPSAAPSALADASWFK